jgi:hypothetical protein
MGHSPTIAAGGDPTVSQRKCPSAREVGRGQPKIGSRRSPRTTRTGPVRPSLTPTSHSGRIPGFPLLPLSRTEHNVTRVSNADTERAAERLPRRRPTTVAATYRWSRRPYKADHLTVSPGGGAQAGGQGAISFPGPWPLRSDPLLGPAGNARSAHR